MAESTENYVTAGLSGAVGQLLTFRQRAGKTLVSKYPRKTTVPASQKLRAVRSDFAGCIAYAKAAIKDPVLKARYQTAAKGGQTAFNVATSEALNRLKSAKNQTLEDQVSEPFHMVNPEKNVARQREVTVSIYQQTGELLEKGNAVFKADTRDWLYHFKPDNPKTKGLKLSIKTSDLLEKNASVTIILT